jgi:hypothetical protein
MTNGGENHQRERAALLAPGATGQLIVAAKPQGRTGPATGAASKLGTTEGKLSWLSLRSRLPQV